MTYAVHNRYHFSFGQKVARLERFKSCFEDEQKPALWFDFVSFILFNAPKVHLDTLHKAWIDRTINEVFWAKCVAKLQKDWEEAVLTVSLWALHG